MFTSETASKASKIATAASLKRRALEKEIIKLAIDWNQSLESGQDGWQAMPQIRLSNAVTRYSEFLKYGT